MPMSSGTVQIYRQNGVSIFCVFFSNHMTTLSDWMEDALINIKRLLAGHIQLAIQQDLSFSEFQSNVYSNLFYFFQSVFTYDTVVIWFCGSGDVQGSGELTIQHFLRFSINVVGTFSSFIFQYFNHFFYLLFCIIYNFFMFSPDQVRFTFVYINNNIYSCHFEDCLPAEIYSSLKARRMN